MNMKSVIAFLLLVCAQGACPLTSTTDVLLYVDEAGGVGPLSHAWTVAFFAWFAAANPGSLEVAVVTSAADLSTYYTGGCRLSDAASYPALKLYVQPGGDAENASLALGPGGRDNILDFAASPNGHYMGTCAGWFYAAGETAAPPPKRIPQASQGYPLLVRAGTYWWYGDFFGRAWAPHWWPTVEGPIVPIAPYPAYAPTTLSNGLTMVYFGGPIMGLNKTGAGLPSGAEVVASYAHPDVPPAPAVVQYEGPFVRALFSSPHPEAQAGVGLACDPPLPPGCITPAQQLDNWKFLAENINTLLGTSWSIPTTL